jgi:enoyl-CoA hydratase
MNAAAPMGEVRCTVADAVASIVFDRPTARNAMTWQMYDGLVAACDLIVADRSVRVATLRGAGGEAFVAGTDIGQFAVFASAEDGVVYEQRMNEIIGRVEALPVPTVAIVDGPAMGGGLILATVCDFRLASPAARFGVPIARTVGNCLSIANLARLVAAFGTGRTRRLLLLADVIGVEEAAAIDYAEAVPADALDQRAAALCSQLKLSAPLTIRAARAALHRLTLHGLPEDEDLVRLVYGSGDFKAGVAAFLAKTRPDWRGE